MIVIKKNLNNINTINRFSVFLFPSKEQPQTPVSDQRAFLIGTEMVNCHFFMATYPEISCIF